MPFKDPARKLAYQRSYQNGWHKRRKAEFMKGMVCERCGGTESLRLAHREGGNLRELTGGINPWSLSKERFEDLLIHAAVYCGSCWQYVRWGHDYHEWVDSLELAG